MRIGMLVDTYKPHVSGITNYIDLNQRHLEAAGHEVHVFTFGGPDHRQREPRVHRSPGLPLAETGYYLSLRYSNEIRQLLQTMDVAHVHHPFLSGRLALHYCRPAGIPIVFTNHTRYDLYAQTYLPLMPGEVSQGLLQAYMPSFCGAVDLVISPSAGMKSVLRQFGVTSHVEVVPNGVELQRFHAAAPHPRRKLGFKTGDLLLGYAGRVAGEKNLDLLLRAFAGVAQAVKNAQLLIVGGGPKPVQASLRALTERLNLTQRVRFTGMVPYDELPHYLAMCDVFVTTSVTEVHPLSVIEAMSAGLPVVGIHSPGVGDTVVHGRTGFLATHDLAAYTALLTRLCLDPHLIQRMGRAARRAAADYDIQRTSRIVLGHYQRLAARPRPRRRSVEARLRDLLERFLSGAERRGSAGTDEKRSRNAGWR
jgi:glycosyltransferase involved in cell wall biosynthesis